MSTLATPANMRAYEEQHPAREIKQLDGTTITIGPRMVKAYSFVTGETYSASSGDYWDAPPNEPLHDSDGEPMVLVTARTMYFDALTGEAA